MYAVLVSRVINAILSINSVGNFSDIWQSYLNLD